MGVRAGMFFKKILKGTCQRGCGGRFERKSESKTCRARLDLEGAGEERPRNGSSDRHVFQEDSQKNMPEEVWWHVGEEKRVKNMPGAVGFGGSW